MTWLRGLKLVPPSCTTDCDLKILSVLQKFKQLVFEKSFHVLFHVIITNEVQARILQAYISLPRHICKSELIKRIIALDLCDTAVGCRVVNGPTSSGPNPKINLKPKSCPKKPESWVRSKKFSNITKLFWLFFCTPKKKVRLRPELSPKLLSTLGPNPTWKARPDFNSGWLPAILQKIEKTSKENYVWP